MKTRRHHKHHRRRSRLHRRQMRFVRSIAGLLAILVVGAVLAFVVDKLSEKEIEYADERVTVYESAQGEPSIYVNDTWYAERDVETLLVIGVDDLGEITGADSYNNGSQADFITLLVRDRDTNQSSAIQINRDTMADIPVLGVTGERAGARHEQLALAYYYGRGEEDSCQNTVNAVSNLLYGIDVEHYIAVTMDAVPILNDWVGGVRMKIEDDFSGIDDELVYGEEVLLRGKHALNYVQARSGLNNNTNLARMDRQKEYASAWFEKARPMFSDYQEVAELFSDLEDYHFSDCSVEQLKNLAENFADYPPEEMYQLQGVASADGEFMEFHVDEAALQQLVLDLFYVPVEV